MVPSGWQVMVWVLFMELPDSAAGSVQTKVRDSPTAMEINPESGSGLYPLSDWGTAHLKLALCQVCAVIKLQAKRFPGGAGRPASGKLSRQVVAPYVVRLAGRGAGVGRGVLSRGTKSGVAQ